MTPFYKLNPANNYITTHAKIDVYMPYIGTLENNGRELVSDETATLFDIETCPNTLDVIQFFEDGFPYLDYLSMVSTKSGAPVITKEEMQEYYTKHPNQEEATYQWLKDKGYTKLVCRYYDQEEPYKEIDFLYIIN